MEEARAKSLLRAQQLEVLLRNEKQERVSERHAAAAKLRAAEVTAREVQEKLLSKEFGEAAVQRLRQELGQERARHQEEQAASAREIEGLRRLLDLERNCVETE